jgi:hypothetical protein
MPIPLRLDPSSVAGDDLGDRDAARGQYELCGAVLHVRGAGVLSHGHYVTLARVENTREIHEEKTGAKREEAVKPPPPNAANGRLDDGWVLLDDAITIKLKEQDAEGLLLGPDYRCTSKPADTGGTAPGESASECWQRGFGRSSVVPFLALYSQARR